MEYYGTSYWAPTDLAHYGVLGMKWGVRRYQNKDGSFNAAGKKRYFSEGSGDNYKKLSRSEKRAMAKQEKKEKKEAAKTERREAIKKAASNVAKTVGPALKDYQEKRKEEAKKFLEEEAAKGPIKDKLEQKLQDRLDRGEISEKEYDRLMNDMDDMDSKELKALSDEVTRQQRSEMAKRYLKDYQFTKEKTSDTFNSPFSNIGENWTNDRFTPDWYEPITKIDTDDDWW